jgi:hypothetical protein
MELFLLAAQKSPRWIYIKTTIDWKSAHLSLLKRMALIIWKQLQLTIKVYIYLEDWQVLLERVLFINCSWKLFLLSRWKCFCSGGLSSHRFAQTGSESHHCFDPEEKRQTFSKERWVGLIFINSEIWYGTVTLLSQQKTTDALLWTQSRQRSSSSRDFVWQLLALG